MNSTEFTRITFKATGLTGKWKQFIGDPSPNFSAMVFGKPKFGKSRPSSISFKRDRISGNKKILRWFGLIMGDSHRKDSKEKTSEIQKPKKELEVCQGRLANVQTFILDKEIFASDYNNAIKARLAPGINKLTRRQYELTNGNLKGEDEIIASGFDFLNNLPKRFNDACLEETHRIVGSTFPEKLVVENGQCRTDSDKSIFTLLAAPAKHFSLKKGRSAR